MNWTRRTKYFEVPGSLYPFDVRHDPTDVRFLEREPDGRLRVRVHTEPALVEGVVVVDGHGTPLDVVGRTSRFTYWEAFVDAESVGVLEYTFAFKDTDGVPMYVGRPGVAGGIEGWEPGFRIDLVDRRAIETPAWAQGAVI